VGARSDLRRLVSIVSQFPGSVLVSLDAAGLGLFSIAGAVKALDYHHDPVMAILMGAITGVGGGTLRDVLLVRVPSVLRVDIYAVAALLGASVMMVGIHHGLARSRMMLIGGLTCFFLRIVSVWQGWQLPKVLSL